MTRFKNPRELEEEAELERELADIYLQQQAQPNGEVVPQVVVTENRKTDDDDTDWKSRYAELRRHSQQEKDKHLQENLQLKRQLEGIQNGTVKPPKSRDEINQWKDDYPEFADVLDTWIKEAVAEQTADLRRKNAQSEKEKALLRLKEKHPDAEGIFVDKKFHEWMKEQSQLARDTIYNSFDVKGASFILDKFKAELGIKSKKSDGVAADDNDGSARAVKVKSAPSIGDVDKDYEFSESQIERESDKDPKWWDANEEKIHSAQRRGKILRDISGGAR